MSKNIIISEPLVSVAWLWQHFDAQNLIVLDASIPKVTAENISLDNTIKSQIKDARFMDLDNEFSDTTAMFPNTMLTPENFQVAARKLGIHKNSALVVYDDLGIYSSPRAWWMFKTMGHDNIAVLDGGLPEWKKKSLPFEDRKKYIGEQGDFVAHYRSSMICDYREVLRSINDDSTLVIDSRSENRFFGVDPEPREGVRGGHIPKSKNIPYSLLLEENKMASRERINEIFDDLPKQGEKLIFSCGSGITACVLALGSEMIGLRDKSVYDGSWTEWGSLTELPLEK